MSQVPSADPALLGVVRAAGLDAGGLDVGGRDAGGLDAGGATTSSALEAEYRTDAAGTVAELGRLLARLHALALPEGAPVLDARAIAKSRRAAFDRGELDGLEVGAAYRHVPVDRLVTLLEEGAERAAARAGEPVLTHGRPTLEVFRWDRWTPLGLADWEHLAVADRNRDLAVAARSIVTVLEPAFLPPFFDAYGHDHLDLLQLDWYSLALELDPRRA